MLTATDQANALIDQVIAGAVRAAETDLHALECHGCRLGAVDRFLKRKGVQLQAMSISSSSNEAEKMDNPNQLHAVKTVLRSARLRAVANGFAKTETDRLAGLKKQLAGFVKDDLPDQDKLFKAAEKFIGYFFQNLAMTALANAGHLSAILHHVNVTHLKNHFDATVDGPGLDPDRLLVFGTPLGETYAKLGNDLFYRFKAAIRAGLAQDETPAEIAERLDGSIAASPVNASDAVPTPEEAIDRRLTVGVRIFDQVENAFANVANALVDSLANGVDGEDADDDEDKTTGIVWLAIMDSQVCPACEALDGTKYNLDYEPVDPDGLEYPGDPPIHGGCRCSTMPCDLDEPAPTGSFRDYMANFSDEEKRSAFGSQNYEAWKAGKISDSALSNQKDTMLSLDQLQQAYLKDGGLTEKQVSEGIPDLVSKYWSKGKK